LSLPPLCADDKTAGQEMFCHYRRCAPMTKQRDKMCFWSTAGTPETPDQAPPDTRLLATLLLPFCYPFATTEAFRAAGCYLFATLLLSDCYPFLFARHNQGTLAMYTSPRRKGNPSESRSSLNAAHLR